jgi:hypothetical protein
VEIFYGAAHMPEMSKKLEQRGFKPVDTQWQMAWDVTIRPNQPSAAEKLLKSLFDDSDSNGN